MAGRAPKPPQTIDEVEHLFDTGTVSNRPAEVTAALASLQARWGGAAPRRLGTGPAEPTPEPASGELRTAGALALALAPAPAALPGPDPASRPATIPAERVISTGFPELDAILGPGGLPHHASVAIRGDGTSGRTTLALRMVAEAQAVGSVVAWVDFARAFDPVEAVARGVRLEWLVIVTPQTLDEGLAIAGALLTGRSVDLLLFDLPGRVAPTDRPARVADRLHRLAALARRVETLLVVLDPPGRPTGISTAVAEATGLRLELTRRDWIRLGRDVVGQRTEALVARNRFGPPGRRAELRILYADGGERDACLRREELLAGPTPSAELPDATPIHAPATLERTQHDAIAPSPLAASPPRAHPGASLRTLPDRADDPRRPAVVAGVGRRREPGGPGARRPAGHGTGRRPSARAGGGLPRTGS